MRILLIDCWIHDKNLNGLKLMCKSINAELVISNQIQSLFETWDLVYIPSQFIEPEYMVNAKNIIYGPHAFLFPTPPWNQYKFDSRCKYLLPSTWTENFVNETGRINLPIIISPFAVDVDKFSPTSSNKCFDILLYTKHRSLEDIKYVESILKRRNITYKRFDYSQKYKEEDYIKALNECHFAVWITSTESQGFALEECLSMDIPILVWNATSLFDEINSFGEQTYKNRLGEFQLKGTTIPYWDERCGISFIDKNNFEKNLDFMIESYTKFHPRDFVLENLSPKVCMERLLEHLQNLGTRD
jgi:hypothetical protein